MLPKSLVLVVALLAASASAFTLSPSYTAPKGGYAKPGYAPKQKIQYITPTYVKEKLSFGLKFDDFFDNVNCENVDNFFEFIVCGIIGDGILSTSGNSTTTGSIASSLTTMLDSLLGQSAASTLQSYGYDHYHPGGHYSYGPRDDIALPIDLALPVIFQGDIVHNTYGNKHKTVGRFVMELDIAVIDIIASILIGQDPENDSFSIVQEAPIKIYLTFFDTYKYNYNDGKDSGIMIDGTVTLDFKFYDPDGPDFIIFKAKYPKYFFQGRGVPYAGLHSGVILNKEWDLSKLPFLTGGVLDVHLGLLVPQHNHYTF